MHAALAAAVTARVVVHLGGAVQGGVVAWEEEEDTSYAGALGLQWLEMDKEVTVADQEAILGMEEVGVGVRSVSQESRLQKAVQPKESVGLDGLLRKALLVLLVDVLQCLPW